MAFEDIESAALKLKPQARARLATTLLNSLELLNQEEVDRVWAEEAVRRSIAWDDGELEVRSAEEVLRDIRSRL